jgi:hypothetical protein
MTLTNDDKKFIEDLVNTKRLSNVAKTALGELIEEKGLATKKDVENIVVETINEVVIPGMDNMAEDIKSDLGMKIDSLGRKFDSQQERQDRLNARIEKLEKIHSGNAHIAAI